MQKVYLFGGGNNAHGVIEYIGKENVIAIIDNESKRQGDSIRGIPIISFEEYKKKQSGEKIVITAAMYDEIVWQLEKNNIFNYTIAPMIVMGLVTPKEIADEWNLYEESALYLVGYNIVTQKFCDWMLNCEPDLEIHIVANNSIEEKEILSQSWNIVSYDDIPSEAKVIIFKERLNAGEKQKLAKFANRYDIYTLAGKSNRQYVNKLTRFKNSTKNQKCFIVGNGPSLKIMDLERIQQLEIPNFGLNLIYKLYNKTVWRPTYFVFTEYNMYRTYYDEIINLRHDNMFIKNFYCMDDTPNIEGVNYYPGCARRSYYEDQKFSNDITKVIYSGYSVMYDTIQIAVYMGFKEIYLIGADFSYLNDPGQRGNHVYDDVANDRRKVAGRAYLDVSVNALVTARKYAELHGMKIYNATRGGKLEVFERKNLDEVFMEMETNAM